MRSILLLFIGALIVLASCRKDDPNPQLDINNISVIQLSSEVKNTSVEAEFIIDSIRYVEESKRFYVHYTVYVTNIGETSFQYDGKIQGYLGLPGELSHAGGKSATINIEIEENYKSWWSLSKEIDDLSEIIDVEFEIRVELVNESDYLGKARFRIEMDE